MTFARSLIAVAVVISCGSDPQPPVTGVIDRPNNVRVCGGRCP
jgi:hypothetical protein